jgi:hypothetical protein
VRTGPGESDDDFDVRCTSHIGDYVLAAGQLAADMEADDDAGDKQG